MPLSRKDFEALIVSRKVFYFSCPEALNTEEPHFFICITKLPDDTIVFSCCTSQFDTVRRLIERNKFSNKTLIYMPKEDEENPFNKDTYINCNEYFPYSLEEFWLMYQNGLIEIKSDVPLHSFEQILIGFRESNIIDEELKENLPHIDNC